MAPFLNSIGWRDADQPGGQLADARLVADERDARTRGCFSSSASTAADEPPGASASTLTIGGCGLNAAATISAVCRARTSGLVSTTSSSHAEPRQRARRLCAAATCRPRSAAAWCRPARPRRAPRRCRDESGTARRVGMPAISSRRARPARRRLTRGQRARKRRRDAAFWCARSARGAGGTRSRGDRPAPSSSRRHCRSRRRERGLHLADAIDQHLEIVQSAEHVLSRFSGLELRPRSLAPTLRRELRARIAIS